MLENNEFYIKYHDKYIVMSPSVYVHQTPSESRIAGIMNKEQLKHTFESCALLEVNDDAVYILQLCDGTKTLQDVIAIVIKEKNITSDKAVNGICAFLNNALSMNYIKMLNDECFTPLVVTGSKEFYYPIHFVLELTSRCNLKCKHCYRSADIDFKEIELTYDEVIGVIDEMYNSGARFIELTGGELLMHPYCEEIIKYVCQKFFFVGILTNGVLLTEKLIEELDEYKNILIWSISLDSCKEEFHNDFRGSSIAFKNTVNAIKNLRKHGHLVRVSMSVVEGNFFDVEDTLEFAKNELDATWFGYNMVMPYGRGKDLDWSLDAKTTMARAKELDQHQMDYQTIYPGFLNVYTKEQMDEISKHDGNCGAGWKTVVVSSKGNVRPCVMGDEKYIVLGNILKDGIKGIVEDGKTLLFKNLKWPIKEECGTCQNSGFCNKCPLRAFVSNEERARQGIELCAWAQKNDIAEFINLEGDEQANASGCMYNLCKEN